jgi:hypothetical protein
VRVRDIWIWRKKNKTRALFVTGTSSSNIRNGDAFAISTKERRDRKAVFGSGKHDRVFRRSGVSHYGIAKDGFNISSVQFAIHYFFENKTTLNSFMRNLSECTKVGGHVIGTCYDGTTVFNLLSKENKGGACRSWITVRRYTSWQNSILRLDFRRRKQYRIRYWRLSREYQ